MVIADLHIHSKYSRATSRDCDAPHLELWARRKGIGILGTGDFTHPAWRGELAEQLEPAEEGFYTLRESLRLEDGTANVSAPPRFVVSGEISCIYKKAGRVRKVHSLILLPGLEAASALSGRLEAIGNIRSDGRPILGLDCRDLLEITLEACPEAVFIPAHIWTPHFSLFGAFSGFDRIQDCFEDLTPHIHALETGLSSDPPMNRRVSALDAYALLSNSDAHSPAKLGREANLLDIPFDYPGLARGIRTGAGVAGTLEFFPEEGKYHLDGHRNCHLRLTPAETEQYGGKCPACGGKLTIGVLNRVEQLADRPEGQGPACRFESLVPLQEVIAASTGAGAGGKRVEQAYFHLLHELGPELYLLREAPPELIAREAGSLVAEGIRRLRAGQVQRVPGYDGEYGTVRLFLPEEIARLRGQISLFGPAAPLPAPAKAAAPAKKMRKAPAEPEHVPAAPPPAELNPEQRQAVLAREPVVAVIAGPGTGKTKTLVARILHLLEQGVPPKDITAVTFTNLAAGEMRERLEQAPGSKRALRGMRVGTFHSICLESLEGARLLDREEALSLAAKALERTGGGQAPRDFLREVSRRKNGGTAACDPAAFEEYDRLLQEAGMLDFDDLLLRALERDQIRCAHLLVDEFQDVNDLQYRLALRWSRGGQSLFVIGDPDQSIYGFRGAGGRCFERLREEHPQTREIRLVQNYRSTPQILSCALGVINRNPGGRRCLAAAVPGGPPVRLVRTRDPVSEGIFLAKEIARMAGGMDMLEAHGSGSAPEELHPFSHMAVLCRTHRQLELIERCLRHDSIPCLVTGRQDFLSEASVRGALGFFRSLYDPGDRAALLTALTLGFRCPADLAPRAEALLARARAGGAAERAPEALGPLLPWMDAVFAFLPLIKGRPRKALEQWRAFMDPEDEALGRLAAVAAFYRDFPGLLEGLALGEEGDIRRASGKAYAAGAVRLMTLHGAKGLEFPVVFLPGLNEGTLPLETGRGPGDEEEERRLFYVGLTRARRELVLLTGPAPSPFLADLPREEMEETLVRKGPAARQLSLF